MKIIYSKPTGEALETTGINEVCNYWWINRDGTLNKNIVQTAEIISGVLECVVSGIRKVVQTGAQRPLEL